MYRLDLRAVNLTKPEDVSSDLQTVVIARTSSFFKHRLFNGLSPFVSAWECSQDFAGASQNAKRKPSSPIQNRKKLSIGKVTNAEQL